MSAAEIIETTVAGRTFRACRFCAAHIADTAERLPGLYIIQPPFNVGVAASAGTHDKCAAFDVSRAGSGWIELQNDLRRLGWAAWYRYPPTFSAHVHMVSLGCPAEKGIYVPGQIGDYYAHRNGLAGHTADDTWHPRDIDSTIFDFAAWLERTDMTPDQDARLKRVEAAVTALQKREAARGERTATRLKRLLDKGDATDSDIRELAAELGVDLDGKS